MCACRIAGRSASRPVCGKYRIAVSLREGFFLLKKKRIAKLSMLYYPSEFPVSHRSVISSMGTLYVRTWKMQVFRINTLEEWEEDCSENGLPLELAGFKNGSHISLYPLRNERMMGIDKKVRMNDILNLSHTYFYSDIRAYAHSKTEFGFLNWLWVCSLHTL